MSESSHGFLEAFRRNELRYESTRNYRPRLAEILSVGPAAAKLRGYKGARTSRCSVFLRRFEAFAALFAVAVQCVENDGISFERGPYLIHLDGLAFELFVILEETPQHEQTVGRHFSGLMIRTELGIFGGDSDDFMVRLAGIDHGHEADGAGVDDGKGYDGFLAEHQNIERIVVFGERLRDEAVVGG